MTHPAPAAPATPVVPSATAPAAGTPGQPVPAPVVPTAPVPSPVEARIAEARARLEAGQPLITPAQEGAGAPPPAEATPTPTPEPVVADPPPGAEGEAPVGDPPPPEGEEGAEGGEEGAAGAGEEGAEGEGEGEPSGLVVKVPGRRPGEPDLELEVTDPVVAERLNQMRNGYMRAEDARAALREARGRIAEVDDFRDRVAMDPTGFVLESVDPDQQVLLALSVLTDARAWPELKETLEGLVSDDRLLELTRAKLTAARLKQQKTAETQIREARQATRNAAAVMSAVEQLVPPSLSAEQARLFVEDCRTALRDHVNRNRLQALHPLDVPAVLAARLRAFGVDPVAAAAKLAEGAARKKAPAGRARGTLVPGSPAPSPASGGPTGASLVQGRAARVAAAAPAPAGVGVPGGVPVPPPNQTVKERIEWARKNGALAR